ncbi:hypothetical protein VR46_28955 [Streptomyces sp. NRRL S-444]|nr:hypothetical protein VR46_28955 [Streptomyces sp. NRRL S-444]
MSAVPQPAPDPEAGARPGAARPGSAPAKGSGGLPKRVRQASLAPQLKNSPAPAPAEAAADPVVHRDADDVRTRMTALQRGWTAGRKQQAQQQSGTGAGTSAATGPGSENEGDGR